MKKKSLGEVMKTLVPRTLVSVIVGFIIYLFSNVILRAIFYDGQNPDDIDPTPIYLSMVVIFQIAFWIVYVRRTSDDFSVVHRDSFSWKEDFLETLKGPEGRAILLFFGILAVLSEGAALLFGQNVVTAFLLIPFALEAIIPIPVVRILLAYLVTVALIFLQLVWQHSRDFKKWGGPPKH